MDKVAIINSNIPIKAIPKEKLQKFLMDEFSVWISDLLSLTDEKSARRLLHAMPAIETHCWSIGVNEIKKVFEMYADGKLSIKPIPNYFDRILVGQIFDAYKQSKRTKSDPINEEEYKKEQDNLNVIIAFDTWQQDRELHHDNHWMFTYLEEKGILTFSKEEKKRKIEIVKSRQKNNINETAKTMLLCDFFARLESKGNHIKNLL